MKKSIILLLVTACLLSTAFAEGFVQKSLKYPEGEELWGTDYQAFDHLLMRYADDKTPIPLSGYYDGYMHATIPEENADRPLEAFISEEKVFADDDQSFEIHMMKKLSARGIINGYPDGKACPDAQLTRAEATAMTLRFLGITEGENTYSGFEDVEPTDWCAKIVATAKERGIVNGDSKTTFNPNRLVSREEMVVMVARALYMAGIQKEIPANPDMIAEKRSYLNGLEEISPWAVNAYYTIAKYVPVDEIIDENGEWYYTANPQSIISRSEVAEIMFRAFDSMQVYPSQTAIKYGFDKKMPVIDGSTSTYPFTQAVYRNLFLGGYNHPDKPIAHSKSHASYERLINGEVDMLFASVYPASDILALAEEKGVELELIPIAYDAMIFFTNAQNSIAGLTKEQISDIYVNNSYENWSELGGPDASLYPYCRNNDSGSHAQMEKHFLMGNEIHPEIRQETTSVTMANVLTDVMDVPYKDPQGLGLGYSIYYYFNNMDMFYNTKTELKLLSVDGVSPTDETIADGSYPLSNNTYVVIRSDEKKDSPARKMAEFMLTDLGQACVSEAGFGALK